MVQIDNLMMSSSPKMQEVISSINKIANTDVPVLLIGEKGTGKRLFAQTIHNLSSRQEGPYTIVDCDSLPGDLIEVELFGYQKGAFKWAYANKKGLIELSQGGTLLINNIEALSLSIQASIFSCIEKGYITRIGDQNEIRVNIRFIATAKNDLMSLVQEGNFRDDLYFGLVKIFVPPLRDRPNDIIILARSFLKKFAQQNSKLIDDFSPSAENAICAYEWSGNIRELENRIKRSVVMTDGTIITPKDLELPDTHEQPRLTLKEERKAFEREMINEALARCKGNITRTAEELGISCSS